jgi:hypothetical protein
MSHILVSFSSGIATFVVVNSKYGIVGQDHAWMYTRRLQL